LDKYSPNTEHGQAIDRAFLLEKLEMRNCVLLESARQDSSNKSNILFYGPITILTAQSLDQIPSVFEQIEKQLARGYYVAGYFAYECGYHFEDVISNVEMDPTHPLLWLGVYSQPVHVPSEILSSIGSDHEAPVRNPQLKISQEAYTHTIQAVKRYIENGDTYQVNFTDHFEFETDSPAPDLYFSLRGRQHVPYSALIRTGDRDILSFSPELFFRRTGNVIETKPMKGTGRRGRTTAEDDELSRSLHDDEKNRSENLMIVDLLRNDIGRICTPGSVQVSDMFAVERYETVLQMTSTVTGTLQEKLPYYDIFKSLFPCGSVTGAPKIRTMQIIHELERHRRDVYCGAIGYFSPNDEAVFNVGIRTISLQKNKGTMGVGSGIVFDSSPEKEFEECTLKANFLLHISPDFQLLETIKWNGSYFLLDEHLKRMQDSAGYFMIPFDRDQVIETLREAANRFDPKKEYRVRLLVSRKGIPSVEKSELTPGFPSSAIKLSDERTDSTDVWYFHKTTHRPLYTKYFEAVQKEGIADYIFRNERDEITEGTYTNIFIKKEGKLYTPPLSSGILNGIFRSFILASDNSASEKPLFLEDLRNADEIVICNSLRGMQKVTFLRS
jgi:para-aminobenzoate synthetase/4-amino-4-deoxychorismate lyase